MPALRAVKAAATGLDGSLATTPDPICGSLDIVLYY